MPKGEKKYLVSDEISLNEYYLVLRIAWGKDE